MFLGRLSARARAGTAAVISFLLVLPLVVLEVMNRAGFNEDFPSVLFSVLWLLPFSVMFLLPAVVADRTPKGRLGRTLKLLAVVLLLGIAWFWFGLIADQMPCFIGVPNCD